jgi:predicted RND superfamily exporter protein
MAPEEQASQEPGGPVFDLQKKVNDRFRPRIHITSVIVEDRERDILRQEPLWELYRNEEALRRTELGGLLYNGYDPDNERRIFGIFTIADAVQNVLRLDPAIRATLETATDDQVKQAVHRILESPTGHPMRDSLSKDASFERRLVDGREVKYWRAQALSAFVASDNQELGGGPFSISLTGDDVTLGKERFNRRVQEILRGDQSSFRLWGIAIDINLESEEQGRAAVPFIVATVVLVLVVVGVTLRSLRVVGLTFLALVMLLVWLKGGSNLLGLKSSLTLDFIVPIAMISLGVDFVIHAVVRYQEERRHVHQPALALVAGFAGVLGALTLAMLSDGVAFLANTTSGIETVIGFGIGAGIAVFASYVIMGVFLPLVIMRLDQRRLGIEVSHGGATAGPGAQAGSRPNPSLPGGARYGLRAREAIGGLVVLFARFRWAVLPATAILTGAATILAFQLEPELDVKEFFDADSDFVISLDKLDQHTGPALSGEPAVLYVEGDLTARESLDGIQALLDRLGDNERVGRTEEGEVSLYRRTVLTLLSRIATNEYASSQVLAATGVAITDTDEDRFPDTPGQVRAAYDYMTAAGVPLDAETLVYDSGQVRETLFHNPAKDQAQGTIILLGILGTRQQANVRIGREALERDLAPLLELPTVSFAGITGSPFTRESTLRATTRALSISLPLAVAACFVILVVWMRSLSFALVTVIPVGLVVSWLYAFMYLAGFHLNFVTATVAAVSIGVGIDYSIHMTQRFREECGRDSDPVAGLRTAAEGTGVALASSAASSVAGFAVMSFAPMPLFSTYGIMTAMMIFMAAGAALLILPSLLLMVGKQKASTG